MDLKLGSKTGLQGGLAENLNDSPRHVWLKFAAHPHKIIDEEETSGPTIKRQALGELAL